MGGHTNYVTCYRRLYERRRGPWPRSGRVIGRAVGRSGKVRGRGGSRSLLGLTAWSEGKPPGSRRDGNITQGKRDPARACEPKRKEKSECGRNRDGPCEGLCQQRAGTGTGTGTSVSVLARESRAQGRDNAQDGARSQASRWDGPGGEPERAFPRTVRWPRTFGVPLSSRTMRTRTLQTQWLADAYPQGAATSGSCNAAGRSAVVPAATTDLRWHRHHQFSRCMQS